MGKCEYCQGDYANPFNLSYSPLWFAWRPVSTNYGIAFLKNVHRRTAVGGSENLAGPISIFWYEYYEHTAPKEANKI